MRRQQTTNLVVLALLLAGSVPVSAQGLRVSVGPHVGWANVVESNENSLTLGLATRVRLAKVLAGELAVDWRSDDIESGDIRTIPVQVSGLLYLLPAVHATFGIAWYHVDASLQGVGESLGNFDDSRWDAGLHLGAGIELPVSPRTSVTAEARYVFLGYELEDAGETIQNDADFINVVAGIQFYAW